MKESDALPLLHSWPIWDAARQFELGHILNSAITDALEPSEVGKIGAYHAGLWECDLVDDSLLWSGGVYDIFGLPRGTPIDRNQTLALYAESSRSAVQRLRAYAIKHRRGFTIDVEIYPVGSGSRWMRLIAAPECDGHRVTRLQGLKLAL